MKLYPEEWECAVNYQNQTQVPRLSTEQLADIRTRVKQSTRWFLAHPYLHNTISLIVLCVLFAGDLAVLLLLPQWLLSQGESSLWWAAVLTGVSAIHGFITYSVVIYTIHEGGAHGRIIQETGPITRGLAFVANNLSRVFYADPIYYRSRHTHHHADFGTPDDGAFTNFVLPKRFWISLLPFAGILDFNDYRIHMDTRYSKSRLISWLMGTCYIIGVGFLMVPLAGWTFTLLVLVLCGPWISFLLDRLRETTEHNLMPLDTAHGARNFGWGFWGLLVGGGPWGQACHLSHHLAPSLPWYLQFRLHLQLKQMLTPEQKSFFLIRPLIGYPCLLVKVLAKNIQQYRMLQKNRSLAKN